jgi:cytochrome c oxidase cbb3-type subunit I/II
VYEAARLAKTPPADPVAPVSKLQDVPVLNAAKKLDVWSKMGWHRRWERLPVKFTVLTTLAVVIASLFEIIPTFLIRSNIPTIATVKPYTPLELAGRDIYVSEGCFNCHSQMIRPMVAETKRYGEYSKPGEFIYDHPFQWGSRRIGPDLAREGGKQSSVWHWRHFENPQFFETASVMPSFEHLLDTPIDFKKVTDRVWAAGMLGAEYDFELSDSPELARKQAERVAADIVSQGGPVRRGDLMTFDSQAVALIAYLQRLGTDINAPPEPAAPAEQATPPDAGASPSETAAEQAAAVDASSAPGTQSLAESE